MKFATGFFGFIAATALAISAHAAPPADPPATPLSDAEVLGLLATANDAEINAGQVAITKGQKQEVKDFGLKMVTDHTANNIKIKETELKSTISRIDSDASRELKKNADAAIDGLKNAKDADFDKTYIDGQVMMHQELLTSLDTSLIPNAQNADVKAYLTDTRAAVEAHLKEAQAIQASLNQP
jgi:putative membrane protein